MTGADGLSLEQFGALSAIRARMEEIPICLIGGMALACQGYLAYRQTQDLDLAIAVPSARIDAELGALEGWSPSAEAPHRWLAPGNTRIDVIPIPPEALQAGRTSWADGTSMSLTDFRHLLTAAIPYEAQPDLRIMLAPPALIAFLKVVAFQERPGDRVRDLGDIAFLLDEHREDARIFAADVIQTQLPEDLLGAFLLGRDLAQLLDAEERTVALDFSDRILQHRDGGFAEQQLNRQGPPSWRDDPDRVRHIMRAFERGLRIHQ